MVPGMRRRDSSRGHTFYMAVGRQKVKGREVAAVELQWCWLWEIEMGKGRRWGAVIFEGDEARWLHGAKDG
jgi:hypothetical protein